jgi:hypothetical protein
MIKVEVNSHYRMHGSKRQVVCVHVDEVPQHAPKSATRYATFVIFKPKLDYDEVPIVLAEPLWDKFLSPLNTVTKA